MKNSLSLTDQSIYSYLSNGLDCMTQFEMYFLPTTLVTQQCNGNMIRRNKLKLPPRKCNNLIIKNIINNEYNII